MVCLVNAVLMGPPLVPAGAAWGSRRCLTRLGCLMHLGRGSESLVCRNNKPSLALLILAAPPLASAICPPGISYGKRRSSRPWGQRLSKPDYLLWWDFPLMALWSHSIFWWHRAVSGLVGKESTFPDCSLSVGLPARFPLLELPCPPGVVSRTPIQSRESSRLPESLSVA